jgi:hypothetical protein
MLNLKETKKKDFIKSIASLPVVKQFFNKQRNDELSERAQALQQLAKIVAEKGEWLEAFKTHLKEREAKKDAADKALSKAWGDLRGLHNDKEAFLADLEKREAPLVDVLLRTCYDGIDDVLTEFEGLLEGTRATKGVTHSYPVGRSQIIVSNEKDIGQKANYLFAALDEIKKIKLLHMDDADAEKRLQKIRDGIPTIRQVARRGDKYVLVDAGHALQYGAHAI